MTKIIFTVPNEFQHVQYINATIDLSRKFENEFKELSILNVEIKIFICNDGEQYSFVYERENDGGYIMIPFVRYIIEDKLTELSNVEDFSVFINSILSKLSNDYTSH